MRTRRNIALLARPPCASFKESSRYGRPAASDRGRDPLLRGTIVGRAAAAAGWQGRQTRWYPTQASPGPKSDLSMQVCLALLLKTPGKVASCCRPAARDRVRPTNHGASRLHAQVFRSMDSHTSRQNTQRCCRVPLRRGAATRAAARVRSKRVEWRASCVFRSIALKGIRRSDLRHYCCTQCNQRQSGLHKAPD